MPGHDLDQYLDQIQIGTTTYALHDARITGGVLNFKGAVNNSSGIVDGGTPAEGYKEGDVVVNTQSGKEFVVVNINDNDDEDPILK